MNQRALPSLDTKAVTYMLTHDRIVEALSSVRYTPAVKVPLFRGRSVRGHIHDVLYGLFMQHALDGEFLTMEEFRKAVYELVRRDECSHAYPRPIFCCKSIQR